MEITSSPFSNVTCVCSDASTTETLWMVLIWMIMPWYTFDKQSLTLSGVAVSALLETIEIDQIASLSL